MSMSSRSILRKISYPACATLFLVITWTLIFLSNSHVSGTSLKFNLGIIVYIVLI
jgi:hypothetical protein